MFAVDGWLAEWIANIKLTEYIVTCNLLQVEGTEMALHLEILEAVRRICLERGQWTFTPNEIVVALPHLKASSIRTHVVSRCCVNAPKHHLHRWKYFRRVGRATYELLPALRVRAKVLRREPRVAEVAAGFGRRAATPRDTVHAFVTRERDLYIAECLELAVVTQGRTLDELVARLREAVELHLDGESPGSIGVVDKPRISLTYELPG